MIACTFTSLRPCSKFRIYVIYSETNKCVKKSRYALYTYAKDFVTAKLRERLGARMLVEKFLFVNFFYPRIFIT